ncbi:MAG TPA: hypothetical protein VGR74_16580, partial [Actinomycetota bacterium]|nr:hypothetical protein [Actinomycetota bacterium]
MPEIEYAVDIWDLSGTDGRPNAEQLLEHLREFAEQGWELLALVEEDQSFPGSGWSRSWTATDGPAGAWSARTARRRPGRWPCTLSPT